VGVEGSLWRALAAFRWLSIPYAAVLVWANDANYAHPVAGWLVVVAMLGWTAVVTARPPRTRMLLGADLAIASLLLLATRLVETPDRVTTAPTLTVTWSAGPVVAWAIVWGVAGGVGAGFVVGLATILMRGSLGQSSGGSLVLLVLSGAVIGYVVRLALGAQASLARAVELQAATAERERLARRIHDGTLQTLALIHRRGERIGGEAAELAALAAEQEATLRELVARGPGSAPAGTADLRALLATACREAEVPAELAAPAAPVLLPAHVATETADAVAAALGNVARHAGPGARAWVFVEDADDEVTVSVRDDGAGFEPGRLDAAAAAGRLGVAQSITGRVTGMGGGVRIDSTPGKGTEVEMRIPRAK
jgi:signal transduction histidine kinase